MADSSIRPAWLWIPWKKSPKNWRRKLAFFWKFLQILRNFAIFWRQFQTSHFGWKKMEKSAPKWTFFQSNVVLWTWQPLSILETFFDILAYFWIQSDRIGREWGKWPLFLDKFGTKSPNLANLGSKLDFRFQTKNRIFGSKFYIHSILNHWPIIGPTFGAENRHFSPKKAQKSEKPIPMPSKSRTWEPDTSIHHWEPNFGPHLPTARPKIGPKFGAEISHFSGKKAQKTEKSTNQKTQAKSKAKAQPKIHQKPKNTNNKAPPKSHTEPN